VSGTHDPAGTYTPDNYAGTLGTGDVETDPLFVSKSTHDFRLDSTSSPCSEAARGSTSVVDHISGSRAWNYDGKVAGVSSANFPDMGAYEFAYAEVLGVDTLKIGKVNGV
jgi:hypothetical protein